MLKKVKYTVIKTDDNKIYVNTKTKVNAQISVLPPGRYNVTIEKEDSELIALKRYYFKMESELAKHLGMKKVDLHMELTTKIGKKVDIETGELIYESLSDIKEFSDMMQRVYELQQFAALECNYTIEPYEKK